MKYCRTVRPSRKFAVMGVSMISPEGFAIRPRMPASWRICWAEPRAPESAMMKIGLNEGCFFSLPPLWMISYAVFCLKKKDVDAPPGLGHGPTLPGPKAVGIGASPPNAPGGSAAVLGELRRGVRLGLGEARRRGRTANQCWYRLEPALPLGGERVPLSAEGV